MDSLPKSLDLQVNKNYWTQIASMDSAIYDDVYVILSNFIDRKMTVFCENDTLDIGLFYEDNQATDSVEKIIVDRIVENSYITTKSGCMYRIQELYLQDKLEVLAWLQAGWFILNENEG